jgi:hypothetical protein
MRTCHLGDKSLSAIVAILALAMAWVPTTLSAQEEYVQDEAEFRWRFWKRFGMVAFAGVGEVAESVSDFNTEDLLPSAGLGLRFMLSEDHRLNLSVDWARGQDSDAWYFYVGGSF